MTRHISAFANSDGGDLYIGLAEVNQAEVISREWAGFANQEAANGHMQAFEQFFPLGTDFQYEFLACDTKNGLVLHAQISKTQAIVAASNAIPYIRRGAQSLPVDTADKLQRLQYSKGVASFENDVVNVSEETVTTSAVVKAFITEIVPTAEPESCRVTAVLRRTASCIPQTLRDKSLPLYVESFLAERAPRYCRSTLRGMRVSLGRVMSWAVQCEWLEKNPCSGVKLPHAGGRIQRTILTPTQVSDIAKKLDEPYATLVLFLAITGLRIGEAVGVKRSDFDDDILRVRRPTQRKPRSRPVTFQFPIHSVRDCFLSAVSNGFSNPRMARP